MKQNYFERNEQALAVYKTLPTPEIVQAKTARFPIQFNNQQPKTLEEYQWKLSSYGNENLRVQDKRNGEALQVLTRAPKNIRENESLMLTAIAKNHNAFEYASPALKADEEFVKKAISQNPAVYNHLTLEQKENESINRTYLQEMWRRLSHEAIGDKQVEMLPCKIDEKYPISNNRAINADTTIVKHALDEAERRPSSIGDNALSKAKMYSMIADAHMEVEAREQLREKVWEENKQQVLAVARHAKGNAPHMEDIAEMAMKTSYAQEYSEKRIEHWQEQQSKYQNMSIITQKALEKTGCESMEQLRVKMEQEQSSQTRTPEHVMQTKQPARVMEKEKIEVEDKELEKEKKAAFHKVHVQQAKEAELAYIKQSSIDYVLSMQAIGLIEPGDASLSIGMISNIPNVSRGGVAIENLAKLGDVINDYQCATVDIELLEKAITQESAELNRHIEATYQVKEGLEITQNDERRTISRDPAFYTYDHDMRDREMTRH